MTKKHSPFAESDPLFESDYQAGSAESMELYKLLRLSGVSEEELALHTGHRERLRMLLERSGVENILQRMLVEFLLFFAIPRQDVSPLARALLDHFGSMCDLLHARREDFIQVEGVGETAAEWLDCISAFFRTLETEEWNPKLRMVNYRHVLAVLHILQKQFPKANIIQLCIDKNGNLQHVTPHFVSGGWNSREAVRVILCRAAVTRARRTVLVCFKRGGCIPSCHEIIGINVLAETLNHANGLMMDMVFLQDDGLYSLRQNHLIYDGDLTPQQKTMCEDYVRGMPPPGEPLRAMPYTDEEKELMKENEYI